MSPAGTTIPNPNLRLASLARHGRLADERARERGLASGSDDLAGVSASRRAAWRRVLSSIATAESLEGMLMEPLLDSRRSDAEARDYLETHAADERRHHETLVAYLKNTFGFVKKKRTFADRVLYDGVFPRLTGLFRRKPLHGFALILCYEKFSVLWYERLLAEARADEASRLVELIQAISKDELRHIAGMELLLRSEIAAQGGLKPWDPLVARSILELVLLDVDMRPWALHNREVAARLRALGLDTGDLTRTARQAARATLDLMRRLS